MKLFKSVDDKLKDLGFEKVVEEGETENKFGASYMRVVPINNDDNYIHRLDILHKASGKHLIQSYEEGTNSDGFNNMVGLTYEVIKLAMKKYRQLKRKYKWN